MGLFRPRSSVKSLIAILLGAASFAALSGRHALAGAEGSADGSSSADVSVMAAGGTWAALYVADGRMVIVDLSAGSRYEWEAPAPRVTALAFALEGLAAKDESAAGMDGELPPGGEESEIRSPVLLIAGTGERGGACTIHAVAVHSGESIASVKCSRPPEYLLSDPRARTAYLVSSEERGDPGDRAASGKVTVLALGLSGETEESSTTSGDLLFDASISPGGDRIYLAFEDRIQSLSTEPLRSSWMLRSPGRNRALVPLPSGELLVIRDSDTQSRVARFDPENLPGRDPVTGAIPMDDATHAVDLPFGARSLIVSMDGHDVAVLDQAGDRVALVDLEARRVREAKDLPGAAMALFHPVRTSLFLFRSDGALSEMVYARDRSSGAEEGEEAPATGSDAEPVTVPLEDGVETEEAPAEEAPQPGAEPGEPSAAGADTPDTSGPGPVEPELAPGKEVRGEPDAASAPAAIRGTIKGEISLVEAVVLYGPDSIFKEHARAHSSEDGTFSIPLPPPGRYRVLLAGVDGAQLLASPPYRHVVVASEGIDEVDFEVSGKVRGALNP
jgi:hypothetical protein